MDYKNQAVGSAGYIQADKSGGGMNLNGGFKYTLFHNSFFDTELNVHFGKYFGGKNMDGKAKYGATININFPLLGSWL